MFNDHSYISSVQIARKILEKKWEIVAIYKKWNHPKEFNRVIIYELNFRALSP